MSRNARGLMLLVTLVLAGLGQYYFAKKPEYFLDAVMFYSVAVALMVILLRPSRPQAEAPGLPRRPLTTEAWVRVGLVSAGLVLTLLVLGQLSQPQESYWPVFWLWVTAMMLYLAGFVSWPERNKTDFQFKPQSSSGGGGVSRQSTLSGLRLLFSSNTWEWGLVLLLLILAFGLRAWRIDSIPWTLSGDEGNFGLWAREVLSGKWNNMFITGHLSMPSMYAFWQAAWLKLAGDDILALRLPWAVVGTLSVLGTYLLVYRLFDRRMAILVAFLLATYHYHIHYSRLGLNNISDTFFMAWSLYFVVLGCQTRRRWAWAAAGLLTGLAFYFYTGSRQVPVVLIAVLVWASFTVPGFLRDHDKNMLVMLGGFVVAVGPMALFAVQHPDDFNARLNQIGIFQSGWLAREVQITGRSMLSILADQFRKAFLAFNLYFDRTDFYRPHIPLMDFLASMFFVLGAGVSLYRVRQWRYAVFVLWFALAVALGGALTESPPSSQRIVSSTAPAVFFVAVALNELTRQLQQWLALPDPGRRILVGSLALLLALLSVSYYFGPYQKSWVYGSYNGEVATGIGYYLRSLGPGWQEYFFGAPRMYADFGSTPFIAKGVQLTDVLEPLTEPPPTDFVEPTRKPVFVFLPERAGELERVRQTYPHGVLDEVYRTGDSSGPLLFVAYRPEAY